MAATKEQNAKVETKEHENFETLIREQILLKTGIPANLVRVQIRRLWGGYYRANVFVGVKVLDERISHSFFLLTDEAGTIIRSTPKFRVDGKMPPRSEAPPLTSGTALAST